MATRQNSTLPGGLRLPNSTADRSVTGAIKPRRHGLASLLTHRTFRRIIQLAFAAVIVFTVVQHYIVGESGPNATASAEAYCPFGGLETLYQYVVSGGQFVAHTHLSNVVLAGAVLLTALLARSAFCGWICPLGFLQDMISRFSAFLQKRVPGLRKAVRSLKTRGAFLSVVDRPLRLVKYGVLVWAVTGAAIYGSMVFRDYDPWAALLNLAEFSFVPGVAVLGLLVVASLFVERPWCRYACPLGAASGLVGMLSPVYLKREASACKSCALCTKSCPMGLPVHTADTIKSPDCIGCLECVESCPSSSALVLKIGLPVIGK